MGMGMGGPAFPPMERPLKRLKPDGQQRQQQKQAPNNKIRAGQSQGRLAPGERWVKLSGMQKVGVVVITADKYCTEPPLSRTMLWEL